MRCHLLTPHLLSLAAALTTSLAGAASLDFGVSYAPITGTLMQDARLRFGIQDVQFSGFTLAAGLSTRGLDAALGRSLVLPGVGVARARAEVAALYGGGLRGVLTVSGTAGPVALNISAAGWNAGITRFDPLARWAEAAPDLRESGLAFGLSARYRLNREVVLNVATDLSAQSSVLAQAELRAEALSYRLGLRAGQDVLGLAAGVTYTDPDSGLNAAVDALAGPNTLGLSAHVGLDDALGEGSSVRVFAAYEPWRTTSEPLRYGAQVSLPVRTGTLSLEGYGGSAGAGAHGLGLKVGYLLPFDLPGTAGSEEAPSGDISVPAQP